MAQKNNFELLQLSPTDLANFLCDNFSVELPQDNFSIEGMKEIGNLLGKLASECSYLNNLLSMSKIQCRELRRKGKEHKIEYEDAIDRKSVIENAIKSAEMFYKTCSRLITIRQEMNNEFKMSDSRNFRK